MPVIDRYNSASIYFKIGDTFYERRVVEGVSADEVLVRLADGSEMTINVDRIGGTLLADQPDIGSEVFLLPEKVIPDDLPDPEVDGKLDSTLIATMEAVYSNGMRKLKLLGVWIDVGGRIRFFDTPGIYFVHEDTKFQDGGYVTREELGRMIGGQDGEKW